MWRIKYMNIENKTHIYKTYAWPDQSDWNKDIMNRNKKENKNSRN